MTGPLLRLREDGYHRADDNVLATLTHRGFATIPLAGADRWLHRLAPYLDGRYSMDDLTANLPADQSAFLRALLRVLIDRGVIGETDPGQETPPGSAEVALLGYLTTAPAAVHEAWCTTPTSVVGAGPVAQALVTACFRSGLRHVTTDDVEPARHGRQVLHVSRVGDGEALTRVERWGDEHRVPLLQVVLDHEAAWIAPPGVCFTAARPRLAPVPTHGSQPQPPAEPALTVLAAQAVRTLLLSFAGPSTGDRPPRLTRFEVDTLGTETHRFVPSFDSSPAPPPGPAASVDRFADLLAQPPAAEDFSLSAAALCDERLGIFSPVTEADLAQLPLRVARTTVALPNGVRAPVHGVAHDAVRARQAAAAEAIRCYSAMAVDERRLVRDGDTARVHGFDLVGGRPVLLPLELVHPPAQEYPSQTPTYRPAVGVAVGRSVGEAVVAGLVRHCRRLTVAEAATADCVFPPVDLQAVTGDSPVGSCLAMLRAVGQETEVYDITGSLGVPTVSVVLGGVAAAYGCGTHTGAALADGLLTATAAWQSAWAGQPEYAPPAVADLSARLRGTGAVTPLRRPALSLRDLVVALVRGGHPVRCALLDHDPHVAAVLPAVHVITERTGA